MHDLAGEVRPVSHADLVHLGHDDLRAAMLFGLFVKLFYVWVFRPLRVLVKGSRRVAAGEFGYRIRLETARRNVGAWPRR